MIIFTISLAAGVTPMIDDQTLAALAKAVLRLFRNKVANPFDAEDLTQKVVERLLSRSSTEPVANLERFAFGVARNVLYEYWRSQDKQRHELDVGELSIAQMGAGMSTMVNLSQWQRLICDALRTLRLDHQMVLELHYWDGKKYDEIAELLQTPPGTIATWIKRGKQQLRERLLEVAAEEGLEQIDQEQIDRTMLGLVS